MDKSYQEIFGDLVAAVHKARPDLDAEDACKRLNNDYRTMVECCYGDGSKDYIRYGGRGIAIAEEWLAPPEGRDRYVLWAVEHGWKPGMTVDRADNDGPYSPGNCRIAGRTLQAMNTRNAKMRAVQMSQNRLQRLLHVGYRRLKRMSDAEVSERLCELADCETAQKREARDRLSRGKCPCCGADAVAVYRGADGRIVGCPDCLSVEDIYAAAVAAGVI